MTNNFTPSIHENKIKLFLDQNYSSIGKISKIENISRNSTNSLTYKISSKNGNYVLHRVNDGSSYKKIERMCEILNFCTKKNIKIQKPIKNNLGLFVNNKQKFFLTLYYNGQTFSGKKNEFIDIAQELARMHTIFRDEKIKFPFRLNQKFYNLLISPDLKRINKIINSKKKLSKIDTLFLKNSEFLYNSFNEFQSTDFSSKNYQLIHHDLHPQNVIFQNGKTSAIIDFSTMRIGSVFEDISFTSYRFSLFRSKTINEIRTSIKLFLKEYFKENSLSYPNNSIFHYFLNHKILSRLSLILTKYYFYNSDLWTSDFQNHLSMLKQISRNNLFDL